MKHIVLQFLVLFFFTSIIGCNSCSREKETAEMEFATGSEPKMNFDGVLKVLQFNVWQEGTVVPGGFDAIVDEVIRTKADLVALSEVRNYNDQSLAERLVEALAKKGHTYYSKRSQDSGILSKFPIILQEVLYPVNNDHGSITKAIIQVGNKLVAFYSAHLDYTHYACYLPRGYDGITWKKLPAPVLDVDKILAQNQASKRDEAIEIFVNDALKENKRGNIVVMAGDFNEPSHLDWGELSKNLFDHNGMVVPWHNSVILQENGFLDAYREKYPDPVTYPGFTWAANNAYVKLDKLAWTPEADDRDRIDFIYYIPNKGLLLKDMAITGPIGSIVKGERVETNPGEDKFSEPTGIWPSDHKGVLATFELMGLAE